MTTREVATSGAPGQNQAMDSVVMEAGRQLRAPWAASIAGLLFSILFTAALLLLRNQPMLTRPTRSWSVHFAPGARRPAGHWRAVPGAVRRDHVPVVHRGHPRPDRRARGPLLRDGLLRQRTPVRRDPVRWLAESASRVVAVRYLGQDIPSRRGIETLLRPLVHPDVCLRHPRGRRLSDRHGDDRYQERVFPRWLTGAGYVVGIVLLVAVVFWDWVILVLPVWVAAGQPLHPPTGAEAPSRGLTRAGARPWLGALASRGPSARPGVGSALPAAARSSTDGMK